MSRPDWYFDVISPYAYLQHRLLRDWPAEIKPRPIPILFAGLLGHWQHKGPAEIPAKRIFTYRQIVYLARRDGIPLRFPPAHPFNPLPALRLLIALDNQPTALDAVFDHIWAEGRVLDGAALETLGKRLGLADPAAAIAAPAVKARLRENGERALAKGLWGVPSLLVGEDIFWGYDSTAMCLDFLRDPALAADAEMVRVSNLPMAVSRI